MKVEVKNWSRISLYEDVVEVLSSMSMMDVIKTVFYARRMKRGREILKRAQGRTVLKGDA